MLALSQHGVTRGYRHYFYGGAPGIAERLSARLQERFPGLQVVGTYCPPFRPLTQDEDWQVIETIRAAQPDIVWVGISSPKQEYWMRDHVERLGVPALIGVGAAFDFHSGAKRQAPRWIQRSGFEWLFRLANEPLRLWPRYRQYPRFVWLVLRQLLHRTG
jgi:N-acetylglucosaminyldiphosphoundecaprenol N-acetyl-beta-D-mannosaminyltransferase